MLSVIISFYNKIELLELIFAALARQTYTDFEVVIADDGSRGDVVERIESQLTAHPFPIKHVWHEDRGWRKNVILNRAVEAASGSLLIFIDGDCLPERHFVEDHYRSAQHGVVSTGRRVMLDAGCTARITAKSIRHGILDGRLLFPLLAATICGHRTGMEQMLRIGGEAVRRLVVKERHRHILGCNFSIFKDDLLKVNGFDERFVHPGYGEDIDLGNRLNRAGIDTISRRCRMIIYHCYHRRLATDYPESLALLEENKTNDPYTHYGINYL